MKQTKNWIYFLNIYMYVENGIQLKILTNSFSHGIKNLTLISFGTNYATKFNILSFSSHQKQWILIVIWLQLSYKM